jgi:hypothetical protein
MLDSTTSRQWRDFSMNAQKECERENPGQTYFCDIACGVVLHITQLHSVTERCSGDSDEVITVTCLWCCESPSYLVSATNHYLGLASTGTATSYSPQHDDASIQALLCYTLQNTSPTALNPLPCPRSRRNHTCISFPFSTPRYFHTTGALRCLP